LFIVNISPPFREFMAPFRNIFPIHNVAINSNRLWISAEQSPLALRNRMREHT
jgi:hypothetical protein